MRVVGSRSAPPASAGGEATMVAATSPSPSDAPGFQIGGGGALAAGCSGASCAPAARSASVEDGAAAASSAPGADDAGAGAAFHGGGGAGPARDQARRQVEPPVADPTRARAPGARPTMALSTRVEEAANPRVPVGATPRSERIRRQAPAPWASPRSGPARLRGPEREARREQHPSSATSTAGSTRRPATPEIPIRLAQAWPAPAPPSPRYREVERPSWGRPSAAGPVSGAPRWRPRLRSGS